MFTALRYSNHSGTAVVGDKVTGSVSGATGIIAYDHPTQPGGGTNGALFVHDVVGTFTEADAISSENGTFAMTAAEHIGENFCGTNNYR